jgi:predicted dehydrogenase
MPDHPIGVGIIGASPDRGWAARAHIPAIEASLAFRLIAVATTRAKSAWRARERFGAPHAFTDARSLVQHPDVDLVVVTVKVPAHVELVTVALDAGKHVYCEWPLTRTADEAAVLLAAAEAVGVHAVVGLQTRFAPAVVRARAILADDQLGAIRSINLYSARTKGNAREIPAWTAYTYDAHDRAGLVEVLGGHALDLVQYLAGPIKHITARTALLTPEHQVAETGEPIHVTAADHLLAIAELESGTVVSIHLHDTEAVLPRTRLEIMGSTGDLALASAPETNPWAAQLQIGRLELHYAAAGDSTWRTVNLGPDEFDALPTEATNVARLYHQLAGDLHAGTHDAPGFRTAHKLHELLEPLSQ